MARPIPKKKSASKFHGKPIAKKKRRVDDEAVEESRKMNKLAKMKSRGWMIAGFDTSMSSIAGAAIGYDATTKKLVGPEFSMLRWSKTDEYLNRLKDASMAHNIIHELQNALGLLVNTDETYIAQEEPVPMKMFGKGTSAFLKQQCEVSGAFLGGLMRYGFTNIFQINSQQWRSMVAEDLGITTHHSKWKSPELALEYNCKPTDSGKFRSKQWALMDGGGYAWQGIFNEIPHWPEIIDSKDGKKPRPENSKAKASQPDDRYDSLAIMWSQALELRDNVKAIRF